MNIPGVMPTSEGEHAAHHHAASAGHDAASAHAAYAASAPSVSDPFNPNSVSTRVTALRRLVEANRREGMAAKQLQRRFRGARIRKAFQRAKGGVGY